MKKKRQDNTFLSRLRKSILSIPLIISMSGCGGVLYVQAPEEEVEEPTPVEIVLPDVRIKGATEHLTYTLGDTVFLKGTVKEDRRAQADAALGQEDSGNIDRKIYLNSRTITPDLDTRVESTFSQDITRSQTTGKVHAIMQFDPSRRTALDTQGIQVLSYLNNRSATVSLDRSTLDALARESLPEFQGISWVEGIRSSDKLSSLVEKRAVERWNSNNENVGLVVRFHKDVPLSDGAALAQAYGATIVDTTETINALTVTIPKGSLGYFVGLADNDITSWIEFSRPASSVNNDMRRVSRVDEMQTEWPQFDGSGIIAGVYDSGTACEHADFDSRLTIGVGEDRSCGYHPTHVSGTVAGSGVKSEEWASQNPERGTVEPNAFKGVIPGAEIVSYSYSGCEDYCLYNSPGDIETDYGNLIDIYDADFITNSIGSNTSYNGYDCGINGSTDLTAVLIDSIVGGALGRGITVLYAAGNERGGWARCGDMYDTLGAPAAGSKNAIIVGATTIDDVPTDFTSFGPTDDGRIGVTICDNGHNIMSTIPGENLYAELSGTSMATPATAGASGAVTQAYRNTHNTRPSPSMVKAVLTNSAEDIGAEGIDYQCGFGRVDLFEAVNTVVENRTLRDVMRDTENPQDYQVIIDERGLMKVTLAWTDFPGDPMSAIQLVSDLDMQLISPEGAIYRPQLLDPSCPDCVPGRGRDTRNNIEQILIHDARPGIYTLRVSADRLPEGPQSFSIAYSPSTVIQPSVIENNSEGIVQGYVGINVIRDLNPNSDGEDIWLHVKSVVDDQKDGLLRAIPSEGRLRLDEIWRGNGAFTPSVPGTYAVLVSFTDEDGGLFQGINGYVVKKFYFKVEE